MRWVSRLMTSAAAVLLATGGGVAQSRAESHAPADAAWADAEQSGTLEAYTNFVLTYPESRHARSAYMKLSGAEHAVDPASGGEPNMADDNSVTSTPGMLPGAIMII